MLTICGIFGGGFMEISIKILNNGCVIINGKIIATNNLTVAEISELVKEYSDTGICATAYTSDAMEMKWGHPGLLKNNFERIDKGASLGYMNDTLEKISKHLCILQESTPVQMGELKEAV